MPCMSPPELDEPVLLRHLLGDGDRHVVEHLRRCWHCRERARRVALLRARLLARLYRFGCPPSERLGEYCLGLLGSEEVGAVARHLAGCPHCRRETGQLHELLDGPGGEPDL